MSQGYLTLATGASNYLEMAKYLAVSIRENDPGRPIALLTDNKMAVDQTTASFFSHVIRISEQKGYQGCLSKLRVYDYTPFEETMFIDSDSLLVKNDMDRHWRNFRDSDFNLAGDKATGGNWYNFDIAKVVAQLGVPYMVRMNSGVFYFKSNAPAREFFRLCQELVVRESALLSASHRHEQQTADEPFIGTAMGLLGMSPLNYSPEEGTLMVTTVGARRCRFDAITRKSYLQKPTGFHLFDKLLAKSWVTHSPSIAHFVQLKPRSVYLDACRSLATKYGLHFDPGAL